MIRLAVIGMGARGSDLTAKLARIDPELTVGAVVDPDPAGVRLRLAQLGLDGPRWQLQERQFISLENLVERSASFDGILIATRDRWHTPQACAVAKTGLPVLLEKPVAINREQLDSLAETFAGRMDSVVVPFPLRATPLFKRVCEIVRSGVLGIINHVQAVNFISYGGTYFGNWYRDYDLCNGLWITKTTHDFDYLNQLLGVRPCTIAAMETRRVYGGDKPADLRCSACAITATCPESPQAMRRRGDSGGVFRGDSGQVGSLRPGAPAPPAVRYSDLGPDDHWCMFSSISNRHHDAASCLISYENGVLVSYSQNCVSRRSAGSRGARITGYLATLEFDWNRNSLTLIEHQGRQITTENIDAPEDGHGGGDELLLRNFLAVIHGREKSRSPLDDAILSVAMSLAARESCRSGRSETVDVPPEMKRTRVARVNFGVERTPQSR